MAQPARSLGVTVGMCQIRVVSTAAPCFQVVSTTPGASSCPGRHRAWGTEGQECVERCLWPDTIKVLRCLREVVSSGNCVLLSYPGRMPPCAWYEPNADQEVSSHYYYSMTLHAATVLRPSKSHPPSQVSSSKCLATSLPSPGWYPRFLILFP